MSGISLQLNESGKDGPVKSEVREKQAIGIVRLCVKNEWTLESQNETFFMG